MRALLLASGLPRNLWAEAMSHSIWLQNRSSTRALDGKTPYEMVTGKKPYLGGILEFGVAAYVKDLTAGKLDACAQKGRFVGYDSESKGYHIYWPEKRSVSVERNVVFNPDDLLTEGDSVVVRDDILNEGESDKVIQNQTNGEDIKTDDNREIDDLPALEPGIALEPGTEHQEHVPEPSIQPPKRARRAEPYLNPNRTLDAVSVLGQSQEHTS
jgi:hypothetical protein